MNELHRDYLLLHPNDNVIIALRDFKPGCTCMIFGSTIQCREKIVVGHKMAVKSIPYGRSVVKFGEEIGVACSDIGEGEHVHVHNVQDITALIIEKERKVLGL